MKQFTTSAIEILSGTLIITSFSIISCIKEVKSLTISVKSRMYPESREDH